jgi:Leucine-rich repeat (LRR) protein
VTVIDVASTTALTYLLCYGNQLTELNVSANTALTILDCNTNQLTALDIGTNVLLTICNASTNQLTTVAADEILVDLNALNVAGTLVNVAGTGNSPVSATGVAAAAGLLADGWATVSYNV